MNQKFVQKFSSVGTTLVIIGVVLSVAANYGIITEIRTYEKLFNSLQDWSTPTILSEFDVDTGQVVSVSLSYEHEALWPPPRTMNIYVKDKFGSTIANKTFTYTPPYLLADHRDPNWSPDFLGNPVYLCHVQTTNRFTVYASTTQSDAWQSDVFTLHVLIENPPPYTSVLVFGIIILVVGIIVILLGIVLGLKKS